MKNNLLDAGYTLNEESNIWTKPGYAGIAYSDGDEVEQRIARIVKETDDISVLSLELRQHCTDWPSLYHLTSTRANILRPFEADLCGADVLEIGAGCGAITRYLGECGAHVLALEGSPRRAAIARSRTRDLPNVTLVSDKFDQFQTHHRFDLITLIGVLEYANLFENGVAPALTMLRRAKALLKPNGKLVIAIENQLGLKYFAGAPEDHIGQPMYGIEGRYRKDQPQTYGRRVLQQMLGDAGYSGVEFMAPFPDYKLPVSVITEAGFNTDGFDAATLASQSVRADPQLPEKLAFSPELVWPIIGKNHLGIDLANSFIVVAGNCKKPDAQKEILAWHFATGRKKEFCKEIRFIKTNAENIDVHSKKLIPGSFTNDANALLQLNLQEHAPYITGTPLSEELNRIFSCDNWGQKGLKSFLERYLKIVTDYVAKNSDGTSGETIVLDCPDARLSGKYFDCVPQNIIVSPNGEHVIDQEWLLSVDINAAFLVFRSVFICSQRITRLGQPSEGFDKTILGCIQCAYNSLGWNVSEDEIFEHIQLECKIQHEAHGGQTRPEDFLAGLKQQAIHSTYCEPVLERDAWIAQSVVECDARIMSLNNTLIMQEEQIAGFDQLLSERDAQIMRNHDARDARIANLEATLDEKDSQIAHLTQTVAERDGQILVLNHEVAKRNDQISEKSHEIQMIRTSTSWRCTAPLRWLKQLLAGVRLHSVGARCRDLMFLPCIIGAEMRHGKGIKTIFSTALHIYKKEGIKGVFRVLSMKRITQRNSTRMAEEQKDLTKNTIEQQLLKNWVIPKIDFDSTQNRFIEYQKNSPITPVVKIIAFYLPQFHPFPENDAWWGKGFTEWTNVGKARPNYADHYQPHCPIHNGYYDLRVPEVMEEQAKLAKEYGIYGFNYYFYWFDGKTLMEKPLEMMLANKKVDMPFCLTWANENWTRRWDGQENDILIAQNHSNEDSIKFIRHLMKYFRDDRYICIDGKPVLIIYRANIIPDIAATVEIWRKEAQENGFPGLYLIAAQTFGIRSPDLYGFDASLEFPPHTVTSSNITNKININNENFAGNIYSYTEAVENIAQCKEPRYKLFRTVMLSWDNTARKQNNSHIFHGFSLLRYKQWLAFICNNAYSNKKYKNDEKLVFVNAWNEWAEGTHLEPDQKFGYGYLQTTYDVISNYDSLLLKEQNIPRERVKEENKIAVILHVHYEETWSEIRDYLLNSFQDIGFDFYVTTTSSAIIKTVRDSFPDAWINLVENRGRDVCPFIRILKTIKYKKYFAVCKIHSKRSIYRNDGDKIRNELLTALMGSSDKVKSIISRFRNNTKIGLLVPEKYLLKHNDLNMTFDKDKVQDLAVSMKLQFQYDNFPAGSMFWFSPESLTLLCAIDDSFFEIESGLSDGTTAHAIERLFCTIAKSQGYSVETC